MSSDFFVTGTDTNVGKTLLSALLVAALNGIYWKPIQTGAWEGIDRQTVMQLAGVGPDSTVPETYCFDPPVSPHLAAEEAGTVIDLQRIRAPERTSNRPLIVEGAGGILVPINSSESMLDLAVTIGMPVIVAARTALGTINHTCLSVKALRTVPLEVRGVVMIGKENPDNERAVERFAGVPVIGRIPHLERIDRKTLLQVYSAHFDPQYFKS